MSKEIEFLLSTLKKARTSKTASELRVFIQIQGLKHGKQTWTSGRIANYMREATALGLVSSSKAKTKPYKKEYAITKRGLEYLLVEDEQA